MTPEEISQAVSLLASWRTSLQAARDEQSRMVDDTKKTLAYQSQEKFRQEAEAAVLSLESVLRQAGLEAYNFNGTVPHPALGVRLVQRIKYDLSQARAYCAEHLPAMLILDTKQFEKHAKAVAKTYPLPFVEIIAEPQVTIAQDLSKFPDPITAVAPALQST